MITVAEARARYLGKKVVTSYGTGPFFITHVSVMTETDDRQPCEPHINIVCRAQGAKTDSYLNGYRLDGTNIDSDDTIRIVDEAPPEPAPAHRVLIRLGTDYYPARLSPGYEMIGDWRNTPEFDRLISSAARDQKFQQRVLGKLWMNHATGFEEFEIEDGRHRFWAAELAGLHSIDGDLTTMHFNELAVRSLCERTHLTPGARAYTVWPLLAPQVEANKEARKNNLIPGAKQRKEKGESLETTSDVVSRESTLAELASGEIPEADEKSLEKLAGEYGISKTLLNQAKRVHEIFARRRDLKAENEPLILSGDLGMGAFLAGVAGKEATEGKARNVRPAESIYLDSLRLMRTRFSAERWTALPEEKRTAVAGDVVETVLALPADVLTRIKLAIA